MENGTSLAFKSIYVRVEQVHVYRRGQCHFNTVKNLISALKGSGPQSNAFPREQSNGFPREILLNTSLSRKVEKNGLVSPQNYRTKST